MSDYAGLVCIRPLSRAIRRPPHCELLRCSGIHLDESALMTELRRDGAHLNNDKDLSDQTNHQQRALSCSLLSLFSPLYTLFLYLFLSHFHFFHPVLGCLSIYFLDFPPLR